MQSFAKRMEKLGYDTKTAEHGAVVAGTEAREASILWNSAEARMAAEAQRLIAQAKLFDLEVPEAVSRAAFWVSPFGKAAPFTEYGLIRPAVCWGRPARFVVCVRLLAKLLPGKLSSGVVVANPRLLSNIPARRFYDSQGCFAFSLCL